ncbi:hypothetical protein BN1058_02181 [Paraliobacillus sp. PM-2]|uniref:hypothetical protein n=1 Tax=Paraliobacillus sp. PM-2 TaxID=1462524 RepID=UPI00061C6A63|nr:hypothetical protein [Paraliobacillus sp. PM-2]CQR47850.1 hypothetical protein BN1058_02181 [Paraliobacillus sp. PM-2]
MSFINISYALLLTWFYRENIDAFFIKDEQLFFILSLLSLIVLYFLMKPVIQLFMQLKWEHFTTYLITILLFGNLIFLINKQIHIEVHTRSASFIILSIVALGVVVIIVRISQLIISHIKQR